MTCKIQIEANVANVASSASDTHQRSASVEKSLIYTEIKDGEENLKTAKH